MRLLLSISLAFACLFAKAQVVPFDTIPGNTRTATVTVRAKGTDWGIVWNMTESGDYDMAAFTHVPDVREVDPAFPQPATLVIRSVRDGQEVTSAPIMVPGIDNRTLATLKIVYDGFSGRLYAGDNRLLPVSEIDVLPTQPSGVGYYTGSDKVKVVRADALYFALPAKTAYQATDVQELIMRVNTSSDPIEGVWEYLDRDITAPTTLGGKYTLATVRDGDAYALVYLDGATSGDWAPLDIKGRMRPTIFAGNYDMTWQCADHRTLDDDTYATISDDRAILTLHFPAYRATLRFRRAKK